MRRSDLISAFSTLYIGCIILVLGAAGIIPVSVVLLCLLVLAFLTVIDYRGDL